MNSYRMEHTYKRGMIDNHKPENDLMHVWFCSKIDLTKKWVEQYISIVKITFRLKSKKKKKQFDQGRKKN